MRTVSKDWSQRLPQPLLIPKVMTLRTLADVRELMTYPENGSGRI
jgi:hypothetical protein